MPLSRREFLAGAGAAFAPAPAPCFSLHDFIEANPKAVFIRRTHVAAKMDEEAKRREGLELAREIFVPKHSGGIPVAGRVVLKPNSTSWRARGRPWEQDWGTGTDPHFYEGLVMGLHELGVKKFTFVEAANFPRWNWRGYVDINERHGIEMNEPERRPRHFRENFGITWTKTPDPVVLTRVPHYAPVNEPGTWLLDIAKWKAHGMCLTLTAKNLQGLVVSPYTHFCGGWPAVKPVADFMKSEIHPRAPERVRALFESHLRMGYRRYASRAELSPLHQEGWAHLTCDNLSTLTPGLAMIEGIYARDGDGFGVGTDYLTNCVIFGKDPLRVDIVGTYLGGHEPGNVHLFRIAKERGLSDTFNPWEVPVFEWTAGGAVSRKLADFERVPLKTYYLQLAGEPKFHLVNEPFDYDRVKI